MRGGRVAWRSGVDHEYPSAGACEYQCRRQSCGAAPDHNDIEFAHRIELADSVRKWQTMLLVLGARSLGIRLSAYSGVLTAASAVVIIVRSTSSCESRPPCSSVLAV